MLCRLLDVLCLLFQLLCGGLPKQCTLTCLRAEAAGLSGYIQNSSWEKKSMLFGTGEEKSDYVLNWLNWWEREIKSWALPCVAMQARGYSVHLKTCNNISPPSPPYSMQKHEGAKANWFAKVSERTVILFPFCLFVCSRTVVHEWQNLSKEQYIQLFVC